MNKSYTEYCVSRSMFSKSDGTFLGAINAQNLENNIAPAIEWIRADSLITLTFMI